MDALIEVCLGVAHSCAGRVQEHDTAFQAHPLVNRLNLAPPPAALRRTAVARLGGNGRAAPKEEVRVWDPKMG